ncbi:MAG: ABC transporter ATP-binding protein [Desulfobacca sp.]|nr:ABC transporter ATP-binding protein [Desulfobacca sp.]
MSLSLIISKIWKSYQGEPILKDCSFSFEANGIYALIGPNGCGKSTLLRICALLEEPDQGELSFFSGSNKVAQDINLKRRITLVLPKVGTFNTSVFKNVAYGLIIRRIRRAEIKSRVDQTLQFVGLEYKKKQNARTLSSGETQRLGLARALVIEPEILFLDEPTASVDQRNTEIIEDILMKIKKEGRSTIIMSTHDQDQTRRLADRVLKINQGTLQLIS